METPTSSHEVDELLESAPPPPALTGGLLRRQIVQYAPGVLLPALVAIVSAVVFTRVFDAGRYGRFSLAMSVASVTILLLSQWLQQGIARFVSGVEPGEPARQLKSAVGLALLLACAVALLLGVVVNVVLPFVLPPEWRTLSLAATSLVIATVLFGPLNAILQSEMRATRYTTYVASTSVLRLVLSLAFVFLVARDVAALFWAQSLALAIALPLLWRDASLPSLHDIVRRWRASRAGVRRLAVYGFPVVGWAVAANLLDASDRWVIQFFRGPGDVGIYSANYSLVGGSVGLVSLPMMLATYPFLMRAWAGGDRTTAGRWLGTIVEWYLVAGALLVGVIGLYSRDIATHMLGPSFREGYRIIPVVLAGMIAWQLGMFAHKPLEFVQRTGLMFALCVGAAVLNVLLNLVVVPRFGYMGAAWTSLVCYAAYTLVVTLVGRRILPWTVRWRRVRGTLSLIALGLVATWLVREWADRAVGELAGLLISSPVALATVAVVVVREVLPLLRRPPEGSAPPA